jgi:signal transduction histidine kinase
VDLNRVIESTLTVCRNEWKYVADLVTEFDTTLTSVPCLPGEFNQVILNLVINASHAIADKLGPGATSKGTITVTTRRVEPWAEVRITDSGTGIPESARDHIFVPFFTTKVVGRGTGQGLAICRSVIVDKHGGTIGFETEIGRGTTFTVRIPLVPPAASAATGRTRPTR